MEGPPIAGSANYGSASTATERRNPLTASRMVNMLLIVLFGVSIVFNITCLIVMVIKHNELVDKFGPNVPDDETSDWCILFMNYDKDDQTIKYHNNNCRLVIYGSGALAGCAFLMMVFLLIRTLLFRKSGFLAIIDGMEIGLTGLFAGVIAVMVSLGKQETCDSLEDAFSDFTSISKSCSDIYLPNGDPNNIRYVQVYQALLTAQTTSWVTVILLSVMGVITGIRVLLWCVGSRRRGEATLDHSLVSHDELQRTHALQITDDEPLPI